MGADGAAVARSRRAVPSATGWASSGATSSDTMTSSLVRTSTENFASAIVSEFGEPVLLLPEPEHPIDEAVMEEEDRIESGRVVLAHVAVRLGDRRPVEPGPS